MKELEKRLLELNYEYEEVEDSIFLINNFLTEEEVSLVLQKISISSQKDWETHYLRGVADLALRKYNRDDIDNLLSEGLIEITNHWYDKNLSLDYEISEKMSQRIEDIFKFDESLIFEGVGTIQRQYAGAHLSEHVDNHADPQIKYAVIAYINNDYNGGELFFSRLNFEIVPPARSLVIFPSGEKYLHGVKPPGEGAYRYVLPSFVRKSEE
jgi:Rps23 Pro-64 3,4-dihydroxylase Tpa1-like proline 4-hydroxylase